MGADYDKLDKDTKEKLLDVFSDEKFLDKLFAAETAEAAQAAFAEKGLEFSHEQIMELRDAIAGAEGGEVSDDQMEQVAGGSVVVISTIAVAAAKACAIGVASGAVGYAVEKGYNAVKKKWGW